MSLIKREKRNGTERERMNVPFILILNLHERKEGGRKVEKSRGRRGERRGILFVLMVERRRKKAFENGALLLVDKLWVGNVDGLNCITESG